MVAAISMGGFALGGASIATADPAPTPYTPTSYTAASPSGNLASCVVSTSGGDSKSLMSPAGVARILVGDSMQFAAAVRNCAQVVDEGMTSDQVTYAPPAAVMKWTTPAGNGGAVMSLAPECPTASGDVGCAASFATSTYKVTAASALAASGRYVLTTSGALPPENDDLLPQPYGSTASQALSVIDPQLKLEKQVCVNSGVTDGDGTGAGEGCDPADPSVWVPSQLVAVGSNVTWKLTVTNTGNVNLQDVAIVNDASTPVTDTSACVGSPTSSTLASGATFSAATGKWSVSPDATGVWPGGASSSLVCTTKAGSVAIVNAAHANATFAETDPNGAPLVNRFSDPADGNSHRVPSNDPSAKVYPVNPELTLAKFVCVTGTGCAPYTKGSTEWVKSTLVPTGTDADWAIVVTNTGSVPLSDVVLSSDAFTNANGDNVSNCAVGTAFPSPTGDGLLAVGASTSIACSTTNVTNQDAASPLINTAQASAMPVVVNPDAPGQPAPSIVVDTLLSNVDAASVLTTTDPIPPVLPSVDPTEDPTVPQPDPSEAAPSPSDPASLASTGSDAVVPLLVGAVMVAVFGGAVFVARRRSQA